MDNRLKNVKSSEIKKNVNSYKCVKPFKVSNLDKDEPEKELDVEVGSIWKEDVGTKWLGGQTVLKNALGFLEISLDVLSGFFDECD